jgi:hypothetical protein
VGEVSILWRRGCAHLTTASSRLEIASARSSLPLFPAADAWRSVLRRPGLGLTHLGGKGEALQPGGPRVDLGGHVAAAQGGGGRAGGAWRAQAVGGWTSAAPGPGLGQRAGPAGGWPAGRRGGPNNRLHLTPGSAVRVWHKRPCTAPRCR